MSQRISDGVIGVKPCSLLLPDNSFLTKEVEGPLERNLLVLFQSLTRFAPSDNRQLERQKGIVIREGSS